MSIQKHCPRCGRMFVCRADESDGCACAGVVLNETVRRLLTTHYDECLCVHCLREMSALSNDNVISNSEEPSSVEHS